MPRRRLHREFLKWLKLNRARFAIGIALGKRTDDVLEFSFVGINPAITGYLSTWDVNVNVNFEDADFVDFRNWDTIFWVDQVAERVPDGYICTQCQPEYKRVFPDRVALWTDHLFETLLTWVNEELAPAHWLILEGQVQSFTSARITSLRPDTPLAPDLVRHVLPLRRHLREQADPSPSATRRQVNVADPADGLGSPPWVMP